MSSTHHSESVMSKKRLCIVAWLGAVTFKSTEARNGAPRMLQCPRPWTIPKVENGRVECACGIQLNGVV